MQHGQHQLWKLCELWAGVRYCCSPHQEWLEQVWLFSLSQNLRFVQSSFISLNLKHKSSRLEVHVLLFVGET